MIRIFDVSSYESAKELFSDIEKAAEKGVEDYESWMTEIGEIPRELFILFSSFNNKRIKILDLESYDTVIQLEKDINEIASKYNIVKINFWGIQSFLRDVIIILYELK
jgi:hypothetical protein